MKYPFILISYRQDERDDQFYDYYCDFSDGSLFRIKDNEIDRIVNKGSNINIPSGLTHVGYLFLVFLSRFFNQYMGNVRAIVCMVLIDFLIIIWIWGKVTEKRYSVITEIKKESETVTLSREEMIKMTKEPLMIEIYAKMATMIAISVALVTWSMRCFLAAGTLEFLFIVPLFSWVLASDTINLRPQNIYRLIKMLKRMKKTD